MVHSGDRGDIVLSSATSCPRVLVVVLLPPKSRQARAQGQLGSIHHASLADRTGPGRDGHLSGRWSTTSARDVAN